MGLSDIAAKIRERMKSNEVYEQAVKDLTELLGNWEKEFGVSVHDLLDETTEKEGKDG